MDVTSGRFFVSEMPPKALCQGIIILQGGAPSCPLEILLLRMQVLENLSSLNEIGKTALIPLRDWKLSQEQPGHGDQVL